jgi:anti-sigma B factor antagonist
MNRRPSGDLVDVHQSLGAPECEPTQQGVVVALHPSIVGRGGDALCHSRAVDLEVLVSQEVACSVVTAVGELDAYSAPTLQAHLDPLSQEPGVALVVDLSGVTFIDSTGLGVMVTSLKHVRATGGSLNVVATSPRVLRVFSLTGIDALIPVHATLAEAMTPA